MSNFSRKFRQDLLLHEAQYDAKERILTIMYKSGIIREWQGISKAKWEELIMVSNPSSYITVKLAKLSFKEVKRGVNNEYIEEDKDEVNK
jgi:ribosomal protein S8